MTKRDLLRRVSLFASLQQKELEILEEQFDEIAIASHTRIYRHGDAVNYLYVIRSGEVSIFRDQIGKPVALLARLESGDFFGQIGFFGSYERSATARTGTPTRLLRISKEALLDFLNDQPAVALRIQVAAARQHSMNVASALDLGMRKEVRIRLDRRVLIETEAGNQPAMIQNLSLGGLALSLAPSSWEPGARVKFALCYQDLRARFSARVSWQEEDTVGLAFTDPSSTEHEEKVQKLLRRLL